MRQEGDERRVSAMSFDITLGGISEKPGVVAHRVEVREYLSVTLSFDHDVIDGAPAARFAQRLRELIESGSGLGVEEMSPGLEPPTSFPSGGR